MKHWIRTLPAKIICFFLCITALVFTAAGGIGAGVFASLGFYTHTEDYLVGERVYLLLIRDSYQILRCALDSENTDSSREMAAFSAGNTNLRFVVNDREGNIVAQNTDALPQTGIYTVYLRVNEKTNEIVYMNRDAPTAAGELYTLRACLEDGLPAEDDYAFFLGLIRIGYSLRYAVYPIAAGSLLLAVICFVILMCVSARRPHSDEIHPGPLNRVPIDLLIAAAVVPYGFAFMILLHLSRFGEGIWAAALAAVLLSAVCAALGLCMSIAARVKQKTLFKNTVLWRVCAFLWKLAKHLGRSLKRFAGHLGAMASGLPMVWRTAAVMLAISLIEFFVLTGSRGRMGEVFVFWLLEKAILFPLVLCIALSLRKLQKGGIALAKGDLGYKIDTGMMFWDFKRHGENLNSIADGMAAAVEERLQSERMKTELITNVSHDIKTPLTSIINYAGLISEEECGAAHHKEYAEVLVRKSEHLRHLLDDLVEISKASSGNLEVVLTPCEAGVLLTQASGEFEQRCRAAELELVAVQPEQPVRIMADGRRIWRVFENLMSNACKYSLPGSRVYLTLEKANGEAVFTFRNTSRTALNISPQELMERFVRGDAARSTEGNGLGLSIARSLTELQNGKMDIAIDGDLFKVTLRFPVI